MAAGTHPSLIGILFLSMVFVPLFEKPIQYSRGFLLLLRDSGMGIVDSSAAVPMEIYRPDPSMDDRSWPSGSRRTGKRGLRDGLRHRLKWQGQRRIPLPTVILANVQSLRNKVDELQGHMKFLAEYRDACLLALTETWLKEQDPSQIW